MRRIVAATPASAMNPWAQAATRVQRLPADLTKHAAELRAERQEIEIQAEVKAKTVPKKPAPPKRGETPPEQHSTESSRGA